MLINVNVLFENDKFVINIDDSEFMFELYNRIIASGPYFDKSKTIVITNLQGVEYNTVVKFKVFPIKDGTLFQMHQGRIV